MGNPNKKWTADRYNAWNEKHAAELEAAEAQYQKSVDDLVIEGVVHFRKQGMTLEDAKACVLRVASSLCGMRNGVFVTKGALKRSLGNSDLWARSEAERKNGG